MSLFAFDLDGTLVDSRLDLAESANELLERYGAAPLEIDVVAGMVGEGARVLVERVLTAGRVVSEPAIGEAKISEALETFLAIYEQRLLNHTVLYPGVAEALEALAGRASLAVLTNKPSHHTRQLLKGLGVAGYFFEAIGIGDGFPRKPDPAGLAHLMQKVEARPGSTVMVGDSMVDLETAARAGTRLVLCRYGLGQFPTGFEAPTGAVTLDRPEDMAATCQRLASDLAARSH